MTDEPVVELADSRVQRAFAALELLAAADVESMNRADLDAVVKARRDVISFTDAVEIRIARRSRQLAAEGRSEPANDVLREDGTRTPDRRHPNRRFEVAPGMLAESARR